MIARPRTKTTPKLLDGEKSPPEPIGQGKRPDIGQFRLQVDRQTKASYMTYEAAEEVGLAIKQGYPILQVAVYDTVAGTNKILQLPEA